MFQRKQTIFLFLGAVIAVLTLLWPVTTYTVDGDEHQYIYTTRGVYMNGVKSVNIEPVMPVMLFYGLAALVLIVGAFLYKNRPRQIRVVRSVYLITMLTAFAVFSQHLSIASKLGRGPHVHTSFGITMFLPLLIVACVFMALKGIKHDEDLVKSADRLR